MNKFKSFTIMLGVFLLAFTTSCTKENPQDNPQNGQFAPGKKIHRIYMSYSNDAEKRLVEEWHWNGNKLESTDYYTYYDSDPHIAKEVYTYDGNHLARVDYDYDENTRYYTLFYYENNVLSSISCFYIWTGQYADETEPHTDTLNHTYTFSYQDEKISQIIYSGESFYKSDLSSSVVYRLIWDGDNLVEVIDGYGDTAFLFEYDTKNNPMYGRPSIGFSLSGNEHYYGPFISNNNCTQITVDLHKDGTYYVSYLYDEDDYPTKQTLTINGNYLYSFYYEYE